MMASQINKGKSFPSPPPQSHAIVLVAAKTAWHADQTKSNMTLKEGSIFAHLRSVNSVLRICPTINLPDDMEDVFIGHDGRPNLIFNQFNNTLIVDQGGITKGDVLMCRCTQNTVVQHQNHIVDIVGENQICSAFDQQDVLPQDNWVGDQGRDEGIEHTEEGGGVLIGEGLAVWESVRESMKLERLVNLEEVKIKIKA